MLTYPDGTDGGSILDPVTGEPKCNPIGGLTGTNGIAHNYIGIGTPFGTRFTPDSSVTSPIPGWRNVNPLALRDGLDPIMLNESVVSPTRNYTAFLNGSYDLGVLGNAEAYFEALYARRESEQVGTRQFLLDYQFGPEFENHPFVPSALYDAVSAIIAINPLGDFVEVRSFSLWGNDTSSQKVDFGRFVGGLRGDLPFGNWQYDGNVTFSRAKASYTFEAGLTDRVYNSLYVVPVDGTFTGPTRVGFDGLTYTCEVNVTNPGTGCVPAPLLDADLLAGRIPQDYRNYVWQDITGHTTYDELTFSAITNGTLFSLPYGKVAGAVGAEYRTMKEDDTPSDDMINGNLYGFTSAGITRGKDAVRELFAELEVPVLRGLKFADDLTVNLSGRYTDYNSYGSNETYKIGLNYAPVGWLKLRGTKGTSFRAPAIFEQYLSPTSGFLNQQNDPCNDYGNLPSSSIVYQNCAAEGLPPDWNATSSVQVNSAGGAALGLKSEISHADTIGIVVQPPLPKLVGDFAFAVDWWRIKVNDQVAQIGAANLLSLCYNDPQFRDGGGYCTYSTRDSNGALTVEDNYINIATQIAEGVDYNVRYTREIGVGEFTADLRATRYILQDSRLLPTDPITQYNGTLQNPKWVGDADLKYKWKDWTFYYSLTYIDSMDSNALLGLTDPADNPFDFTVSAYWLHSASVKYTSESKWEATLGVRNLTDADPKTISAGAYDRVGNSLLYSGYDYLGRRVFLDISKTF